MEQPVKSPALEDGMTVAAWLPTATAKIFRAHVGAGRGKPGRFALAAIEEKLKREGAYEEAHAMKAASLLKELPVEQIPLLARFAELLATRGMRRVEAKLVEMENDALEAAGAN